MQFVPPHQSAGISLKSLNISQCQPRGTTLESLVFMEKVVISSLKARVAPRYDHTNELFVFTISDVGMIVDTKIMSVTTREPEKLTEQLRNLRVTTLICGGIREDWKEQLRKNNIALIDNVIGYVDDVLDLYMGRRISSGDVIS
jgi:hypothetical protein